MIWTNFRVFIVILMTTLWCTHFNNPSPVDCFDGVEAVQPKSFRSFETIPAPELSKTCPFVPTITSTGWKYTTDLIVNEHVTFDDGLGEVVAKLVGTGTLLDVGAGVGQLGYYLQKHQYPVKWYGFDGGENIKDFVGRTIPMRKKSGNKPWPKSFFEQNFVVPQVCWVDASSPVRWKKSYDWVLSVEVGEHIDRSKERVFIENLITPAKKGIILSWATVGQRGYQHINERSNEYIIGIMKTYGFSLDERLTNSFRNSAKTWTYLQTSLMVFRP